MKRRSATLSTILKTIKFQQTATVSSYEKTSKTKKEETRDNPVDITKDNQISTKIKYHTTMEAQLQSFLSMVQLTEKELIMRGDFVPTLTKNLQEFFPGSRLEIIGSTANSLGFTGCDTDLSFFLPFERDERQMVNLIQEDVPAPIDVYSGKFPQENLAYLSGENILLFICKYISHLPGFKSTVFVPRTPCPSIVTFYHRGSNIRGNLSYAKHLGPSSTRLLRLYSQLDFKIYALLMTLRYWAKRENIVGNHHLISSYAFSWLVIFYLQRRAFVPTVARLATMSETKVEIDTWDCTFFEDIDRIPIKMDKPFNYIITGFFEHYSTFSFDKFVVSTRDASLAHKSELLAEAGDKLDFQITAMSVQDVFDLTENITATVSPATVGLFASKCAEQLQYWKGMAREKKMNIKCLFQLAPPINFDTDNSTIMFSLRSEVTEEILPVEKVCSYILDVFKRGLLFDCAILKCSAEYDIHSSSPRVRNKDESSSKKQKLDPDNDRFLFSMVCRVRHRTWMGRKKARLGLVSKQLAKEDPLDNLSFEERLSQKLTKGSDEKSGRILHIFQSTFSLSPKSNVLSVTFTPKTEENELIYCVIPFLKKYVLNMLHSPFLDKYVKIVT